MGLGHQAADCLKKDKYIHAMMNDFDEMVLIGVDGHYMMAWEDEIKREHSFAQKSKVAINKR